MDDAAVFLWQAIFEDLASHDLRRQRVFRDRSNAFDLSDVAFIEMFRLSKAATWMLIESLREFLPSVSRASTALSPEMKVLCALNFYAVGSYQASIGQNWLVSMSQPSVSRCISVVTETICLKLLPRWISFSVGREPETQVKAGFQAQFEFPGVIGAIDCTHVAISALTDEDEAQSFIYINRKGFHSVNIQLICDSKLKILNVNARYLGSTHDSFIWKSSAVRRSFMEYHESGSWLLGDSGYPLEPWLLTPILSSNLTPSENAYNRTHIAARNVIERCNGILKARFRCLLRSRELNYTPTKAGKIASACAVLHNICRHYNLPDPPPEDDARIPWGPINPTQEDSSLRNLGQQTRNNLILTRF